jgi:hypothetical protein
MAFLEYMLLAFIGSTGAAVPAAASPGRPGVSLGGGAVSQPRGGTASGAILPVQCTGGDKARQTGPGKKPAVKLQPAANNRGRHHRRRRSTAESGKKPIKQ